MPILPIAALESPRRVVFVGSAFVVVIAAILAFTHVGGIEIALFFLLGFSVARLLADYHGSSATIVKDDLLRKQEEYLRIVIDAIPDVLFAQDAEGRIQMANQATAEVLGRPVDQIVGRLHSDLSPHSADVNELAEQIRSALTTGAANSVERGVAHPVTGERTWFETRVFPLFPPRGGPVQALVVGTDFTARRKAEEAIRLSQQEILTRLAEAAEFRDEDTGEHTRRVGRLAARIARLMGLAESDVELIEQAAPLHDIGKIGIPDSILLKPGPLTPSEFEVIKAHTVIGGKLLSGGSSVLVSMAEQIALMHHERWDGSGYPAGLREDETPTIPRIVWIADVVDALSHARPYRPAWPMDRVIQEVRDQRLKKFGPYSVDACLEILTDGDFVESWI